MRFLIAGAGRNRSLHRCAHGAGRIRCHALRARAASARHAGARRAGEEQRGRFRGAPCHRQFPRRSGAGRRCFPGSKGARPAATCAAVEAGAGAGHHSRQHAERNSLVVLPGFRWRVGRTAPGARRSRRRDLRRHRSAAGGWVHRLFFNRDYRARSHSTHRGESHFARRTGRHALRALAPNCGGAHRFRLALPGHHPHPARDLGKGPGQRFVESGQRADSRHAGADGCAIRGFVR